MSHYPTIRTHFIRLPSHPPNINTAEPMMVVEWAQRAQGAVPLALGRDHATTRGFFMHKQFQMLTEKKKFTSCSSNPLQLNIYCLCSASVLLSVPYTGATSKRSPFTATLCTNDLSTVRKKHKISSFCLQKQMKRQREDSAGPEGKQARQTAHGRSHGNGVESEGNLQRSGTSPRYYVPRVSF